MIKIAFTESNLYLLDILPHYTLIFIQYILYTIIILSFCCYQDMLLERKANGEFKPSGSEDVLSTALETCEHSGRVRGVGGFVTPSVFFNLPKTKRSRITKSELLARDRQRDEELQRTKQEFMSQIAELKALVAAHNVPSPMLSDKSSCQPLKEDIIKVKPSIAKELKLDDDVVVFVDQPPTEKKVNFLR